MIYLFICLFVYLFICLFVYLFICLFVYLFICLFVYLFICLFVYLFVYLFVCLFICLFVYCRVIQLSPKKIYGYSDQMMRAGDKKMPYHANYTIMYDTDQKMTPVQRIYSIKHIETQQNISMATFMADVEITGKFLLIE